MEKDSFSCVCPWDNSSPHKIFFGLTVQGADQLNTLLSVRSKALKSSLDEKILKLLMDFMNLANIKNYAICLIPYEYTILSDSLNVRSQH